MTDKPTFQTNDPATGQPGRAYVGHTPAEALQIARATHAAFAGWRRTSFAERAALMTRAAQVLRRRIDEFAALMTDEMGKTLTEGRASLRLYIGSGDYASTVVLGFFKDFNVEMSQPPNRSLCSLELESIA